MYMKVWAQRLDVFLLFNEEEILRDKGCITETIAKAFAESEFEKYRTIQDLTYQIDFSCLIEETLGDNRT